MSPALELSTYHLAGNVETDWTTAVLKWNTDILLEDVREGILVNVADISSVFRHDWKDDGPTMR